MHHVLVRNVAVSKDNLVNRALGQDPFQIGLGINWDALRIMLSGQGGRIETPGNIRDLRGGKGQHLVLRPFAEEHIEVVKVATCRTHD